MCWICLIRPGVVDKPLHNQNMQHPDARERTGMQWTGQEYCKALANTVSRISMGLVGCCFTANAGARGPAVPSDQCGKRQSNL